jgi:inorganic pyrophosphatase
MQAIHPTRFESIPTFPPKQKDRDENLVHAIIETPARQRHKYALEPEYGAFMIRDTLAEGLAWPYDYGFIPQTLADDGDPLDILFLVDEPTFPGCLVKARVIGIVHLKKNGVENDRILACATKVKGIAQTTDAYSHVDDLPKENIDGLCRFLVDYSEDQGNDITFEGVSGVKKAFKAIAETAERFKEQHSTKSSSRLNE